MATQEAGVQQSEVDSLPSADAMAKMSHSDLYDLRLKNPSKEAQDIISPYEHRAYAREYVTENPVSGTLASLVNIPAYQAAKAVGAIGSRTGPSMTQAVESIKGVGEGIANAIKKPWEQPWGVPIAAPAPSPAAGAPKASEGPSKPWQRDWRANSSIQATSVASLPSSAFVETSLPNTVKLTPAEQARGDAYDKSAVNIKELKTEITNAKSPAIRNILQAELNRIIGTK